MMFFARWSTALIACAVVESMVEAGGVAAQPVSAASSAPAVRRVGRMQSSLGKAGSLHRPSDSVVN